MNVLSPALHLLLVNFKPNAEEVERQALVQELRRLHAIDGVLHLGAARAAGKESTHAQALFVYLRDATALEAYGSHPLHMEYLRRVFLPAVQDSVSIDVGAPEAPPPLMGPPPAAAPTSGRIPTTGKSAPCSSGRLIQHGPTRDGLSAAVSP